MRPRLALLALALALPLSLAAQGTQRAKNVEKFDVSGLPKTPHNDTEKEIFDLLRVHRRGDLQDATRIHLKLAEYYKAQGDKARADDCTKMATAAWEAASGAPPASAQSPGTPPFEPVGTFEAAFVYADELNVAHTWEFFDDGTFAHSVSNAEQAGLASPREVGWYSIENGQMRLWQAQPATDRTLAFELVGEGGSDGALMDGVRMKPRK
jgi:hypothetical protein